MRLLVIGIGNPVPTFILNRLRTLVEQKVELTVVAQFHQQVNLPGATIIRVARSITLAFIIKSFIEVLLRPNRFIKLFCTRADLPLFKRILWSLKYLPTTRIKNPDAIHLQWIGAAVEFAWLRKFFNCPIIASARGSMVTVYPITRSGYQGIIEQSIQQVDYVHCVSHDIARACEKFAPRKEQLIVNYNGVDLNRFRPSGVSVSNAIFTLISVGALMWRKAYFYQLHIVERLLKSGYLVKLIIAGDGPDREALVYTGKVLGVCDHIEFTGRLSEDELSSRLNQADVYISTSMAEGLANSVVEAAAGGLPIVSFQCEGMREVVEQGVNGFIVPFGNVDGMVEKVIYLATHPEERIKMGLASRRIAEERFDEHVCVQQMIETYKSIAGKR